LSNSTDKNQIYRGYHQHELEIFNRFRPEPVPNEVGFVTDFLNVRTRAALLWEDVRGLGGQRISLPIPGDYRAEAIEWLGLLRSVADAREEYVVMELGAGHGPWLVSGAAAARHIGLNTWRLYGVEADPDRFAFMCQHFRDNGINPDAHTLLNAAVGARAGRARWPRVADPFNEWAVRPALDNNAADASYNGVRLSRWVEIPVLPISDLLKRELRWNLVHIDLQGWEGEICAAAADIMDQRVQRLVVSLHSRRLEGELLGLFHSRSWVLENEKPSRFNYYTTAPTIENMTVLDGVQVWLNPHLSQN
jgi:FkbM family methyltransferase